MADGFGSVSHEGVTVSAACASTDTLSSAEQQADDVERVLEEAIGHDGGEMQSVEDWRLTPCVVANRSRVTVC